MSATSAGRGVAGFCHPWDRMILQYYNIRLLIQDSFFLAILLLKPVFLQLLPQHWEAFWEGCQAQTSWRPSVVRKELNAHLVSLKPSVHHTGLSITTVLEGHKYMNDRRQIIQNYLYLLLEGWCDLWAQTYSVLLSSESPENMETSLKCAMRWWDWRSICCQWPQSREPICRGWSMDCGKKAWPPMAETPWS